MAKSTKSDVSPVDQFSILKNPTLETIEDRSGPRIYDVTTEWNHNGIDPDYSKKDGVQGVKK